MSKKDYIVYVLANKYNTTFYIGVTSNLENRIIAHKNGILEGFSKKYNLTKLVYYEFFDSIDNANIREKQIKKWRKQWKIDLITKINPEFKDLSEVCEIP